MRKGNGSLSDSLSQKGKVIMSKSERRRQSKINKRNLRIKGNRRRMNSKNLESSNVSMQMFTEPLSDSDVRSPYYEDMKDEFVEDFRGFRKDLRECQFWSSVQFDGTGLRGLMENCKKEPMSFSIHSCGGFTGIKHIAFWSDEHKSFMTWRHTPKRLMDGSDSFINIIN